MEDHALPGGGSSVVELLNEHQIQTPVMRVGWLISLSSMPLQPII